MLGARERADWWTRDAADAACLTTAKTVSVRIINIIHIAERGFHSIVQDRVRKV